jgi:Family of unknown function (DUF6350)
VVEVAERVRREARRRRGGSPSTVIVALGAAFGAAVAGLAVSAALVLVAWGADSRSTATTGAVLRAAVQAWLLAHHATLRLPVGEIGILPLGLLVLPAVLLLRSGTSLARALDLDDLATAAHATGALACAYSLVAVVLTGVAGTGGVHVSPLQALFGSAVLAVLAGGAGVLRGVGLGQAAFRALPAHVRLVVRAAGVAVGVLLAAGAVLAGSALAVDLSRATRLAHALTPGMVSGALLLVLCLCYAPNAAVWGAAYAVGPGFAVGVGTSVSPFGVRLGPVPAFPLAAALPDGAGPSPATWPFLAAPLLAGVLAGTFVSRRLRTGDYGTHPAGAAGLWAAVSGLAAGLVFALVAALSGGPLGSGRLAAVGPSPWRVGLAAGTEIGLAAGLTAAAVHWYALRHGRRPGRDPAGGACSRRHSPDPVPSGRARRRRRGARDPLI